MAIQNFDNINILRRHSMPYAQYFGEMRITPQQRKRRQEMAMTFEEIMLLLLTLIREQMDAGILTEATIKQEITYQLYDVLSETRYFVDDEQKEKYITNLIDETYRSTIENLKKYPNDFDYTGEENYWVSNDRAMYIAENEANTVINSAEFVEAKERGCTHKIWDVFPDDRVRMTHLDVYGARIPLDAYFDVGSARLLYPKDVTSELSTGALHPEEIVNCRCSLLYV